MEKELSRCRKELSELTESTGKQQGVIDNLIVQGEDKDCTITRRDSTIRELESELHSTQATLRNETQRFTFEMESAGQRIASTEVERDQIERLRVDAVDEKKVCVCVCVLCESVCMTCMCIYMHIYRDTHKHI